MPERFAPVGPAAPTWHDDDQLSQPCRAFEYVPRLGSDGGRGLDDRLPIVGPAFSACVLIVGAWDYVANDGQSWESLLLRLLLVVLGMPGYTWRNNAWTDASRWMLVYLTHSLALAVNAASLRHGLIQAMPVLVISMLVAGLVEARPRHCMVMLLPTLLFYGIAGAWTLTQAVWLASLATCGIAIMMAALISAANGALRRASLRREQQLLDACRFDSLSGAMSRAYLTELVERDMSVARRHGRPLAVAMLDIDHFKQVNDTHGHATGDRMIRALVDTCKNGLRHNDYIGRIGGEEFVCVMPETGASEALICAERMRTNFERLRLASPTGSVSATVSIGVAVMGGPDGWDALLRDADAALYQAKNSGRNRTVLAPRKHCAGPA
jgi:diguanylate cyclase (GGDEF)-like protein